MRRFDSGTQELVPWEKAPEDARGGGAAGELVNLLTPIPTIPAMDPVLGTTLGSFKITKVIGKGGMGTVYQGEQGVIGSKVAIKVLHDHLASNPSLVQRFYAEARAVNLIAHENIVNIFDMNVVAPQRYYFVMELLEGKPLSALMHGPVAPEVAVPILAQVCDALDAAHEHGVVHRDLKPENIFLVRRGRNEHFVKILDFGIAKLFASEVEDEHRTAAGVVVGTPEYMAPEQATNERIDGRADIYALGVIAYLLLTGRLPFSGGGITGLLMAHREKVAVAPRVLVPSLPALLSEAVMKALAKRPEDRFQTAGAFGVALETVLLTQLQGWGPPADQAAEASPRPSQPTPVLQRPATPMPQAASGTPAPRPSSPATPGPLVAASPLTPAISPSPLPSPGAAAPLPSTLQFGVMGPRSGTPAPAPSAPAPPMAPARGSAGTPAPSLSAPRAAAPVERPLSVVGVDGKSLGALTGIDLSRAGVFVCSGGALPAVFSRVRLTLAPGLEVQGEVVRHVDTAQAKAWNLPPGFGVQFVNLSGPQKDGIARLSQGLEVTSSSDDALAEPTLGRFEGRQGGDAFSLLGLPPDVSFDESRARGREAITSLEKLLELNLSPSRRGLLTALIPKVKDAVATLTSPARRAALDAQRKNFHGVARCLSAGLTVTELAQLRAVYCREHPGTELQAHQKLAQVSAHEAQGRLAQAVTALEEALALDPLNLAYHQKYASLRRRVPHP